MKKTSILCLLVAILSSCSSMKNNDNTNTITLTGTIEKIGMSTFQYGTHLINADDKVYALKSASLKLDAYVDKPVKLKGAKVTGYPVEGGPELIEVSYVEAL